MRRLHLLVSVVVSFASGALFAGEIQVVELESKAIARVVEFNVLLPDGYEENSDRRYPVIYLLHGIGGNYTEWQRVGIVDEAEGLPVIIVMPEGDRSFYANFHEDPKNRWEDHIIEEIIPFVETRYRAIGARHGRGISGLSMGGYGAVMLGLRHPHLFSSVASHSGALGVPGPRREGPIGERIATIFGPEDSETRKKYDLVRLLDQVPEGRRPHIYFDCGSADFLLGSNREFAKALSERGYLYEYREVPGGHEFAYWRANVRYSLTRQLAAFEAAAEAAKERREIESFAGVWNVRAILRDSEVTSVLTLTEKDGKLTGGIEWDDGGVDLDRIRFEGDRLRLEADIERDGRHGLAWVDARLEGEGKLAGKWGIRSEDGEIEFERDWRAEREKAPASAAGGITGTWGLVTEFRNRRREHSLRIEEAEGKLQATLITQDGETRPAQVVTFEDGNLRMEVDRTFGNRDVTLVYEGRLEGGKLSGVVVPKGSDRFRMEWTATKKDDGGGR